MTRLPDPVPGLVFRYDFLRPRQVGSDQVGKERPACILIDLQIGETIEGVRVVAESGEELGFDYQVETRSVVIVPIQSDPPSEGQIGIEVDETTKRHVGLPDASPSYALVSEVNIDVWPNAGLARVSGKPGQFAYPRTLPGPVLARLAKAFRLVREAKRVRAVARQP